LSHDRPPARVAHPRSNGPAAAPSGPPAVKAAGEALCRSSMRSTSGPLPARPRGPSYGRWQSVGICLAYEQMFVNGSDTGHCAESVLAASTCRESLRLRAFRIICTSMHLRALGKEPASPESQARDRIARSASSRAYPASLRRKHMRISGRQRAAAGRLLRNGKQCSCAL
jgi:hypothetical protein